MSEKDPWPNNPLQAWKKADARILGQILAAQNVVFALPDSRSMAEFYAQLLTTVPGITACRVCLGGQSVLTGEMASGLCATCETLRHLPREDPTPAPTATTFRCNLADQPEMRVIAVDSAQHHFGFFVLKIDQAGLSELYQPFIRNLSGYVALILENRWQQNLLQKAHDELERKVVERTRELTAANVELSAYRGHLEELVGERTAELETANKALERMNKLFVGRELRMVELKERIKKLEHSASAPERQKHNRPEDQRDA